MALIVENRDVDTVVVHGSLAGLLAGFVLGLTTIIVSVLLSGSAAEPFRFASSLVVGPDALDAGFPLEVAVLLGSAIHLALATLFGVLFVGLLSLTYQLSARRWLLILYGSLFAFAVWEIDFLVAIPTFFPFLVDRIDVESQLWNGVVSYVCIYGPVLALYVSAVRPGVIDDWRKVGPPAGRFDPTSLRNGD